MIDYAQGTFQVDYEARVDFNRLRSARVAKTQAALRTSGLCALVLWKNENVRYLASLRAITLQYRSTTPYGVMLFPQGQPVLFLSGGEYAHSATPSAASGERMSPPTLFATDKLVRDLEDTILVTEGEPEVLNRCGFDERVL